jgi:hypothetical protein
LGAGGANFLPNFSSEKYDFDIYQGLLMGEKMVKIPPGVTAHGYSPFCELTLGSNPME